MAVETDLDGSTGTVRYEVETGGGAVDVVVALLDAEGAEVARSTGATGELTVEGVVIDETPAVGINSGLAAGAFGAEPHTTFSDETVNASTQEAHRRAIRELIARDKNHPCVVLWCIANESESVTPEARAYFEPLAAEARRLDPTRPIGFANVMGATPDVARWRRCPLWRLPTMASSASDLARSTRSSSRCRLTRSSTASGEAACAPTGRATRFSRLHLRPAMASAGRRPRTRSVSAATCRVRRLDRRCDRLDQGCRRNGAGSRGCGRDNSHARYPLTEKAFQAVVAELAEQRATRAVFARR